MKKFENLLGKVLKKIERTDSKEYGERLIFVLKNGNKYCLYNPEHGNDQRLFIEDVCGDLTDLIDNPILLAEEVSNHNKNPEKIKPPKNQEEDNSFTWTFYKLSTILGSVTIRFYGESNGYYSEKASFGKC